MAPLKCLLHKLEKASLICDLLCQSPPGDFGQVVQDLSALVRDDKLVRQEAACMGTCHNKNNFTPIQINGRTVLLTHYNDLGGNSFFDSQDKFSVEFDHLCGVTIKSQLHSVILDACVSCHFPAGNCCMFKKSLEERQLFVACIEAHQYHQITGTAFGCQTGLLP
uniref:F-actin-capping protein subunit alpha n=1 Tax=Strix occidentalis caurina TaxID=311401 RepID=A0A8D0FYM3_STROC